MASSGSKALRRISFALTQTRTYSAPADRSIPANKQKYVPTSGTFPQGFLAGAAHAGVKPSNTKYDDIALVVSEHLCPAAAVTTRNIFKAAPVRLTRSTLRSRSSSIRGVVVNSGCANAVTGADGNEHAEAMARETDKCFGEVPPQQVAPGLVGESPSTLVMSTGVIGQKLPIDRILPAIPRAHQALGNTHEHWLRAANAICTTDTFPKLLSRTFNLPSHPDTTYSIAGMTKGAGMIHPNMATLLGIICTDVKIERPSMISFLRYACDTSFNAISIDGDTSTNDTVVLLANGAAAPADIDPLVAEPQMARFQDTAARQDSIAFLGILQSFMQDLAKLVVRDGEGATKFVTVRVQGEDGTVARKVAESIVRSPLVKTALYGKDANWGRILCAIGYTPSVLADRSQNGARNSPSQYPVKPQRTSVSFIPSDGSPELKLLTYGEPEEVDEDRAKAVLELEDLEILVKLNDYKEAVNPGFRTARTHERTYWTCDFSHEYVTINGDYRT